MHQKARMLVQKYTSKEDKSSEVSILDAALKIYENIVQLAVEVSGIASLTLQLHEPPLWAIILQYKMMDIV